MPAAAPLRHDAITVALVGYAPASQAAPRCLYVSSGSDVKLANNIVSQQGGLYPFAASDVAPTTVIDLGSSRHINRVSGHFAPQKGSFAVYVLQALPDSAIDTAPSDLPVNLKITSNELSNMRPVALVDEDGSRGDLAADFAPTTGRYVMLRWNPAAKDRAFTLAQVAAFGADDEQKPEQQTKKSVRRHNDVSDSKTVVDSKDLGESKDIPSEGPPGEAAPPAEGPPPGLPPPPPFTFIPQIVPTSP